LASGVGDGFASAEGVGVGEAADLVSCCANKLTNKNKKQANDKAIRDKRTATDSFEIKLFGLKETTNDTHYVFKPSLKQDE
jgi:hypothetical protein